MRERRGGKWRFLLLLLGFGSLGSIVFGIAASWDEIVIRHSIRALGDSEVLFADGALTRLIEAGPKAIPALFTALGDRRPYRESARDRPLLDAIKSAAPRGGVSSVILESQMSLMQHGSRLTTTVYLYPPPFDSWTVGDAAAWALFRITRSDRGFPSRLRDSEIENLVNAWRTWWAWHGEEFAQNRDEGNLPAFVPPRDGSHIRRLKK
jgi:hypothetical protein